MAPGLYAVFPCSGSDMGGFTVEAVTDMICEAAGGPPFDGWHSFVCVHDADKQKWLNRCEQHKASIIIVASVLAPVVFVVVMVVAGL